MATLETMTGAPMVNGFQAPDGRQFTLSAVGLADLGAMNMHLKALPLLAMQHALRTAPEDVARYMLNLAYREIEKSIHVVDRERFVDGMQSLAGVSFILWRSIRKEHPTVTLEQVESWLDEKNFGDIRARMLTLAGFVTPEKKPAPQS